MRLHHNIMKIGLVLMTLTMLICIVFSYSIKLNYPVFLRYCIETEAVSNQADSYNRLVMELQYITNSNDNRLVNQVVFKEAPEIYFRASETLPGNNSLGFFIKTTTNRQLGISMGRYSLRTIYVYQDSYFREDWKGEKELNTAVLYFSDGSTRNVDLGRIILYSETNEEGVLAPETTTSSSDFSSSTSYRVEDNVRLLNFSSPLLGNAPDFMYFKIDNINFTDISGMEYEKGNGLRITSKFNNSQASSYHYDVYDIRPKLNYKIEDGATKYIRVYNIRWQRSIYDFKNTLNYLKERGAI
ncbi:MAG: hypothetical protein PHF63_01830 [Herbinix sp.]|nr:hypothetical protein [Herbinix sp.]